MLEPFYSGRPGAQRATPPKLPLPADKALRSPEGYEASTELVQAVQVALLLRQPLLLTGEPGVGKTRLAYALARELKLGEPLECLVKSSTTKADLFYSIDNVRRFHDAQPGAGRKLRPMTDYLTFNGLGKAILFAGGPDHPLELMPGRKPDEPKLQRFYDLVPAMTFWEDTPALRVVLVDELDKAPRDTPNDMLNEIERMRFEIPELGVIAQAPDEMRPIIVITSNSEKDLPDPFLRRCVYFDIRFPDNGTLRRIIEFRLRSILARRTDGPPRGADLAPYEELLGGAMELIERFRPALRRPPGTAEVLSWVSLLAQDHMLHPRGALKKQPAVVKAYLPALAKSEDDLAAARQIVEQWAEKG